MPEIQPQTKSFFIIFLLAFFSVCFALILSFDLSTRPKYLESNDPNFTTPLYSSNGQAGTEILPEVLSVNTSNWKTYANKEYGFSFKYRPDWKVLSPVKKNGFAVFQVDPGSQYYNFKIYANPEEFYIMDGLPAKAETIGGASALNVKNALFGIRSKNMRLTFDVGWSMQLLSEFNALVHSVEFEESQTN